MISRVGCATCALFLHLFTPDVHTKVHTRFWIILYSVSLFGLWLAPCPKQLSDLVVWDMG